MFELIVAVAEMFLIMKRQNNIINIQLTIGNQLRFCIKFTNAVHQRRTIGKANRKIPVEVVDVHASIFS